MGLMDNQQIFIYTHTFTYSLLKNMQTSISLSFIENFSFYDPENKKKNLLFYSDI